jgi:hypothetical protein
MMMHLSVCDSKRGRILLSVIIGASSDAPDIFKKRNNPSSTSLGMYVDEGYIKEKMPTC